MYLITSEGRKHIDDLSAKYGISTRSIYKDVNALEPLDITESFVHLKVISSKSKVIEENQSNSNQNRESESEENADNDNPDNGNEIDNSFVKMIDYKHYATESGEDISYNTIQRHLKETDQLRQNSNDFEEDDEFIQNLHTVFNNLQIVTESSINRRRQELVDMGVIEEL